MEEIEAASNGWMKEKLQTEELGDQSTTLQQTYLVVSAVFSMFGLYRGIPTPSKDAGRMALELGTPRFTSPLWDLELEGKAAA